LKLSSTLFLTFKRLFKCCLSQRFFSELDLSTAFEQLKVSEELSQLFTFSCSFGKVPLEVLPYGAIFASDVFQSRITDEFLEFLDTFLVIYIDNLIVHTNTMEEHLDALRKVLSVCRKANLHLRRSKCLFMVDKMKTLGFVVSHKKIEPDPAKIEMLKKAPVPKDRTELRRFLGLLQFYRHMLPHLSHSVHRLYALTSTKVAFKWDAAADRAYNVAKDMLEKDIMSNSLKGDKGIILYTDASKFAICAVLVQNGKLIYCVSKVLSKHQRNWAIIEKELLAISWGCKKLRCFLLGRPFVVRTDHAPLVSIVKKIDSIENQRMLTMVLAIIEYDFVIEYYPGVKNVLADFGTRQLDPDEWEDDDFELEDLFVSFPFDVVTNLPKISMTDYAKEDFEEMERYKLKNEEKDGVIMVHHLGEWLTFVPTKLRRAVFWVCHFPRHEGVTYMVDKIKQMKLYFPDMSNTILDFLSQCSCILAKEHRPPPYEGKKSIFATSTLQLLAMDLFEYDKKHYLTMMDIFSKLPFVYVVPDKTAESVSKLYEVWVSLFAEPDNIVCDNGGEFGKIPENLKLSTPANHPQANSCLERFHKELAVMCRVHNCSPDEAVKYLRSHQSKLIFFSDFKIKFSEAAICLFDYHHGREFNENELVWRHVPRRKRKKQDEVFTGPHRVTERLGDYTYNITSSLSSSRKKNLKVNVNDVKKFTVPDTSSWKLNPKYLNPAKEQLNCADQDLPVFLDFQGLETFTLDSIGDGKSSKLFVIPDWPCMSWYRPMHDLITAEAVKLADKPDLFIDENGNPLGSFAWKHWLFCVQDN